MNNNIHILHLFLCWLFIVAVLLPLVKNDYWIFRILEYPRYQKLVLCSAVFISFVVAIDYTNMFDFITLSILALCVIYLVVKIWPYTIMSPKEMKGIQPLHTKNQVKLFSANVFQDNDQYERMLAQIRQQDPDVILLLETNKVWEKQMDVLMKDYPNTLKEPLENTYGMLFYTRFEIIEGTINYLVEKDVPSLEATLKLPSGQLVKTWGLHPKPPVPGENDRSTAKDKELMKVAFKAKRETLPVIIMGDLNDVAWSYVTGLFSKTSGLLDPRRGRGFYSTFSSNYWFMRFPLDYIFCSAHFGLVSMRRLGKNGSDHFAMFSHFEFQPVLEIIQEKPKDDAEEMQEAAEKASQPV